MTTADIDWAKPMRCANPIARRSCRACELTYVVTLDYSGPPLCDGCRADLDVTRARLKRSLDLEQAQERGALATWDAVREPYQAHWEKIQDARTLPDFAVKAAAHRKAGNTYGRLLDAAQAYETALARLGAERERLSRALQELEGL